MEESRVDGKEQKRGKVMKSQERGGECGSEKKGGGALKRPDWRKGDKPIFTPRNLPTARMEGKHSFIQWEKYGKTKKRGESLRRWFSAEGD